MAYRFDKLTRPAMRKLEPGSKIAEHGISFERLANGDGLFTVNIMVDGQRIHRTIGRESDGTTRMQAEEFIAKAKTDARAGRLNLPKGRKVGLGLPEAVDKYIARLETSGGNDIQKKRQRFTLHLLPFLGNLPLTKITSFNLECYKKHRVDEGAKPGTINRELAAISHLFNKAEEWGWIDHRPAKIRRLKEDGGRIVYLTVDQANRLKEAAKGNDNPQVYPFVFIALETSMRHMEILSIRREHVHLDRRIISIPKAKAGAREQPITNAIADFLRDYVEALPADTPWLFPSSTSRSGHTVDMRHSFDRAVREAGLEADGIVPHTLRHTAITHLVQAGIDLPTVQRVSGHKTLSMVARYAHQNGEHIRAAMGKLEERYRQTG